MPFDTDLPSSVGYLPKFETAELHVMHILNVSVHCQAAFKSDFINLHWQIE